jgi:hypothetical protein
LGFSPTLVGIIGHPNADEHIHANGHVHCNPNRHTDCYAYVNSYLLGLSSATSSGSLMIVGIMQWLRTGGRFVGDGAAPALTGKQPSWITQLGYFLATKL